VNTPIRFCFLMYCAAVLLLQGQTATFPTALPKDSDLLVTYDRATTTLSAGINSSTLTIPVTNGGVFPLSPGQATIVTIESEQIKICYRNGNLLAACSDGRGWAGTTQASHASAKTVEGRQGSWHHNRMRKEVQAVATAAADNRAYAFAAISGIDFTGLGTTGAQTLTFASHYGCPLGIAGAAVSQYVRLSDTLGNQGSYLISGGTCTSGGSGTITFTTDQTFGGIVTLGSATAGMKEMEQATGGEVRVAAGTHLTYKPMIVTADNVAIRGRGLGLSTIQPTYFTTANVFQFEGPHSHNVLTDLSIACNADQTAGWAVYTDQQYYFLGSRVKTTNCPSGVRLRGNQSQLIDWRIEDIEATTGTAVTIEGTGNLAVRLMRIITDTGTGTPLAGLRVRQADDVIVSDSHFLRSGKGLLVDPGTDMVVASLEINSTYFDNDQENAAQFSPGSGGYVLRTRLNSCWTTHSGGHGIVLQPVGTGIIKDTGIHNHQSFGNRYNGFISDGTGVTDTRVIGGSFANNSLKPAGCSPDPGPTCPAAGDYHGLLFARSRWLVQGVHAGLGFEPTSTATQGFGIAV
jgi:hypothetical protein